jgi:hypothetical protein
MLADMPWWFWWFVLPELVFGAIAGIAAIVAAVSNRR